ncbi:hypothetical protein [Bartonella australis]|uniref:hypothetical protein n=1 Tax=Bartonella australis TaxID=388640 RepID=UPI00034A8556
MVNTLHHFADLPILIPKTARFIVNYTKTLKEIFKARKDLKSPGDETLATIFKIIYTNLHFIRCRHASARWGDTIMLTNSKMRLGHRKTTTETARILPHSIVFDAAENCLHIRKEAIFWRLQDTFFPIQ